MSYRILVVDHDRSGAERIQRPLTEAGHDVVVRGDAAEAMSTFQEVRPDLAVIEALLPEKSGPALCQEIKDSPAGKATPVVLLLEADEDKQARARALDLHGCDLLIERSIPETELVELLEELLRARLAKVDAANEAQSEPEDADAGAAAKPEVESVAGDGRDPSGKLIDSNGVSDALSKLDAILEDRAEADRGKAAAADAGAADVSRDQEKVRRAERAGDFSFLNEDSAEKKPTAPESPVSKAEEDAASERSADIGQDIVDHIDALFATSESGGPTLAEKQVLSWTFENNADEKDEKKVESSSSRSETAGKEPEEQPVESAPAADPKRPAEARSPVAAAGAPAAAKPESETDSRPVSPSKPVAEPGSSAAASPGTADAMQTASFAKAAPRPAKEFLPPAEGRHRWWVVAACLAVVLIGGGLAILFLGGEAEPPTAETAPVAERPFAASTAGNAEATPVAGSGVAQVAEETADDAMSIESPRQPVPAETGPGAEQAGPTATPAASDPVRAPRAPSSPPASRTERTVRAAREVPKSEAGTSGPAPTARPRRAEPRPEVTREAAPETSSPRAESAPPPATPPVAPTAEDRTTQPEARSPEPPRATLETEEPSTEPAASASAESPVAAAPPPVPAEPVYEPPQLLERSEPDYPAKSLKRASGERIELKLLISDKGRISRVLVEQGTRFKDLEAAAVSAVLRWKYRPAMEDGTAVEAWTTAEFTF